MVIARYLGYLAQLRDDLRNARALRNTLADAQLPVCIVTEAKDTSIPRQNGRMQQSTRDLYWDVWLVQKDSPRLVGLADVSILRPGAELSRLI